MDRRKLRLGGVWSRRGRDEPAGLDPPDARICPHCWMVNPGPFMLCARCGADMDTLLQESAGLRRTAPVQSPVPTSGRRLSILQRFTVLAFVVILALTYLAHLLPAPERSPARRPAPAESAAL